MNTAACLARASLGLTLVFAPSIAIAQQAKDSNTSKAAVPTWQKKIRSGDGPSVGAPLTANGANPNPMKWCLAGDTRPRGDFRNTDGTWTQVSRFWLHETLGDDADLGDEWRQVLGGAPRLAPEDTIVQVMDEPTCRAIAEQINRDVLGWREGAPPVVVFRIKDFLIAYPANAKVGEFGVAVGMTLDRTIKGVATW